MWLTATDFNHRINKLPANKHNLYFDRLEVSKRTLRHITVLTSASLYVFDSVYFGSLKETLNREIWAVTAYGQGRIGKLYLRVCTLTSGYESTKNISEFHRYWDKNLSKFDIPGRGHTRCDKCRGHVESTFTLQPVQLLAEDTFCCMSILSRYRGFIK